jgi:hypothetical protein
MKFRPVALLGLGVLVLGACYSWLLIHSISESFRFLGPGLRLQKTIGVPHGIVIWLEVLNTIAMCVAAVPVALLALVVYRKGASMVVLGAAALAVVYDLVPALKVMMSVPAMPGWEVAALVFDYIKVLMIPFLLVQAIKAWPPNIRLSGRAVNKQPVVLLGRAAQLWR